LVAFAAFTVVGASSPAVQDLFNNGVYNALLLLAVAGCALRVVYVRADRLPWALITCGVACWTVGDLLFAFAFDNDPPFPSIADAFYLVFYPLCYVGLLLLVRTYIADFNRSLWLDGLTAALAAAAVGAAVLFQAVLEATEGSRAAVITNLAYPLGDILMLSLVVGVFALAGWHPGRMWLLVGLGFACSALADAIYLFQEASDAYVPGAPFDALWPASMLLIAWSAWQPAARTRDRSKEGRPLLATPAISGALAIAVLLYDHYEPLNLLALGFAVATLTVVIVRTWLTFRENARILERIRIQATTDALTRLGNRRSLVTDLEEALADGERSSPRLLVIFDLDGFKRYNDTFGHPSGDQLLRRLGGKLAEAVEPYGAGYRLGGDEFCVLAAVPEDGAGAFLEAVSRALLEEGEGFSVTSSFGAVFIPDEAATPSDALRIADQRLYAQKQWSELGRAQPHEVLLQALSEREPGLRQHVQDVAELSLEVGRRLGLDTPALRELGLAAQLHDVGKLAIPDAILDKPGPLNAEEWEFVRRHTIIGQRILSVAPAFRGVAAVVRATHERWDGTGYPDGVAGREIPLAARIIAVCDAFTASTARRPYGLQVDVEEGLAELRRCAGIQFDPQVVTVLCEAVAAGAIDAKLHAA
jgi:diguanylate cyclase (GGDEF)-like protein